MDDWRLLREWVERGSEAAFSNLVSRHVNLVYSTALRRVRDHASAEEVVQSVFCLLAKKAPHLRCDIALVSWLYRTACFKASRAWRDEQRRRLREKDSLLMSSETDDERDGAWQRLAPCLDDAMQELGEEDRLAILLRFFQAKPWREIGDELGIGEDAARMRVNRAIERLRGILEAKSVLCSASLLGSVLLDKVVHVAPASLMPSVHGAWLAAAKAGSAPAGLVGFLGILAKAKLAGLLAGLMALLLGVNWAVHAQRKTSSVPNTSGPGSMGPVSFSLRSVRIDPSGYLAAMIVVKNEGKYILNYAPGVQIQVPEGWAHTNGNINQAQVFGEDYPFLDPGEERIVAVRPPAFAGAWRAFVVCTRGDLPWDPRTAQSFYGPALKPIDPTATNSFVETTNLFWRAQELDALGRRRPNPQSKIAIALYDEAIRLNPTDALYYMDRAAARRHARDLPGAIADLQKAIQLNPLRRKIQEEARKWQADWIGAPEEDEYEHLERNRQ